MEWTPTTWNGEPAYQSRQGDILAIVSLSRARLMHFGPAEQPNLNLLNDPGLQQPADRSSYLNWGGHRFWLGPQKRWRWPPSHDWEFSPAIEHRANGADLILVLPHTDKPYPRVERVYRWREGQLECAGRWQASDEPWYAMHVVAVDPLQELSLKTTPTPEAPLGFVRVTQEEPITEGLLPHPALSPQNGRLHISPRAESLKLGFPIQTIRYEKSGYTLLVAHGHYHGAVLSAPDHGFLTQIWFGKPSDATFSELEQISPFLQPDPETGWAEHAILLSIENQQ